MRIYGRWNPTKKVGSWGKKNKGKIIIYWRYAIGREVSGWRFEGWLGVLQEGWTRIACAKARGHGQVQSCLLASAHNLSLPEAAFPYFPISPGPPITPRLPSATFLNLSHEVSLVWPSSHPSSPNIRHSRSVHPGPRNILILHYKEGAAIKIISTINWGFTVCQELVTHTSLLI